jgi:hypothetical protein
MTTLTDAQLKAALSNEQIVAARTKGLAEGDLTDPVAEEISAACAKVDAYTAGWLPAPALRTAWARDLAAWHVAKRLGSPTESQTEAKTRAEKELEDVRDAKFPGIPRDPSAEPASSGKVLHGGNRKII